MVRLGYGSLVAAPLFEVCFPVDKTVSPRNLANRFKRAIVRKVFAVERGTTNQGLWPNRKIIRSRASDTVCLFVRTLPTMDKKHQEWYMDLGVICLKDIYSGPENLPSPTVLSIGARIGDLPETWKGSRDIVGRLQKALFGFRDTDYTGSVVMAPRYYSLAKSLSKPHTKVPQ